GVLQEDRQNKEGLFLKSDRRALAGERTSGRIQLEETEAENFCMNPGLVHQPHARSNDFFEYSTQVRSAVKPLCRLDFPGQGEFRLMSFDRGSGLAYFMCRTGGFSARSPWGPRRSR